LGIPDKKQHCDNNYVHKDKIPSKKGPSKPVRGNENLLIDNGGRHEVEVRYQDGKWHRGRLSTVNVITGKWIVRFYDDDETTEVTFPDKDMQSELMILNVIILACLLLSLF